jgi:hypothetical protein
VSEAFPKDPEVASACKGLTEEGALVDCLLERRFGADPDAHALVRRLYAEHGIVAGVEPSYVMDDGDYRGRVLVEPALPVGTHRHHLEGLLEAFATIGDLFTAFAARAPAPLRFAKRPRLIRFYETPSTNTPSAWAANGVIGYNVRGELWSSSDLVFETLVHELFHLSDIEHGNWSAGTLKDVYEGVLEQCRGDMECLDRFAPHETKVDGGIYYAFHPTSDVREYGAELAARFVREQRRLLADDSAATSATSFKCQTVENETAWTNLAEEFFGGLDLVPPCAW